MFFPCQEVHTIAWMVHVHFESFYIERYQDRSYDLDQSLPLYFVVASGMPVVHVMSPSSLQYSCFLYSLSNIRIPYYTINSNSFQSFIVLSINHYNVDHNKDYMMK